MAPNAFLDSIRPHLSHWSDDPRLQRLLQQQAGLVARRQLNQLGIDWHMVDHQVAARRWLELSPRVIATFTGALTIEQRQWFAVLHAGPRSMLGGLTAAAHHGLTGWERSTITVYVDDELSFEPVPGIKFFRSRRPFDIMIAQHTKIPCCSVEPAVLLRAGYEEKQLRVACGLLAAVVQQRLTSVDRLSGWLEAMRPLRRTKAFRAMLADIGGGSQSAAERDVALMCRRFNLPLPSRQVPHLDRDGRLRRTDCEWPLHGGVLVLEVEGPLHMEVRQWSQDVRRARRLATRDRLVVRATSYEIRHEPEEVVRDLRALGLGRLEA